MVKAGGDQRKGSRFELKLTLFLLNDPGCDICLIYVVPCFFHDEARTATALF